MKKKEKRTKKTVVLWTILVSLLALVALSLSGCTQSTFTVVTDPSGAKVIVDGELMGETPCTFSVFDPVDTVMVIKKDGYEEIQEFLQSSGTPVKRYFILEEAAPVSFVQTLEPSWASVEIAENIEYEKAWFSVVDLLVRRFDLEVLSKENGYLRTTWLYSWTGELREDYRVRVTVKFSYDESKVEIKSEANYQKTSGWVLGSDTVLLQTLKSDIMGTIGRVAR